MPLLPNFLEKTVLHSLNQGPAPMLDALGGLGFRVVVAALELDIFEVLKDRDLSAGEIADRSGTDPRGISQLLNVLEAFYYLERLGETYSLTAMTRKWLLKGSPHNIAGALIYFNLSLEQRLTGLTECLKTGRAPVMAWEWMDSHPGAWEIYQGLMLAVARMAGDEITAKTKLPAGAGRLLDVGGGHGLYSVKYCRRNPGLAAVILDWPEGLAAAEKVLAEEGMQDRVSLRQGDIWTDDLGREFDVALLFNIIHMYLPDKNKELLTRVGAALNPGGQVIILDQMAVPASSPVTKATAALLGMVLYFEVGGQTYPPDQVSGWLLETGYTNPRRFFLRNSPGLALVMADRI